MKTGPRARAQLHKPVRRRISSANIDLFILLGLINRAISFAAYSENDVIDLMRQRILIGYQRTFSSVVCDVNVK